jgi:hypothetical protein
MVRLTVGCIDNVLIDDVRRLVDLGKTVDEIKQLARDRHNRRPNGQIVDLILQYECLPSFKYLDEDEKYKCSTCHRTIVTIPCVACHVRSRKAVQNRLK